MPVFRVAAVGDNCIDCYQPPLGQMFVGGNAVNVAVQWARLGHPSFYFGAVGADPRGDLTVEVLEANGVDCSRVQRRHGLPTAYTEIELTADGDRIFAFEEFGACAGYRPDAEDLALLKTMDHVHIGWLDDGGALRRALSAAGVSVSQDVSVNAAPDNLGVEGLTVAFASAGDDPAAGRQLVADLRRRGAAVGVATLGARGSMAEDGVVRAEAPVMPVRVVETTGAGDSFIAGFLIARLSGEDLSGCLARGSALAAQTCGHVGGFPQAPRPF